MKKLIRGGNAVVAPSGIVHIALAWKTTGYVVDAVCFGIGTEQQIISDAWFVFYNQLQSPSAAIVFSQPSEQEAEFIIDTDGLPDALQKCVFAAVIEGNGSFRDISEAIIVATPSHGEKVAFRMTEQADERALIFAELYRHDTGWKLRAVGQGFKGGLEPLARYYGVQIADKNAEPSEATPPWSESRPGDDKHADASPLSAETYEPYDQETTLQEGSKELNAEHKERAARNLEAFEPAPSHWPKRLGLFAILLGVIGIGVYYLVPHTPIGSQPSAIEQTSLPESHYSVIDEQTCKLSVEEVFNRYHALGENYLETREIVTDSNQVRVRLTRSWREADFACTQGFLDASQREIDRLRNIPIKAYFQEATRLNICAGELLSKIEQELASQTRPALLQRLMRDADRGRNLESDLTNITRDLAFYDDKIERLIAEYQSNIDACSF